MGWSGASSGRRSPQTLQRFLSLGFNSMLPACHSDLRSAPVIRTAFRVGPKQQSCFRGGEGEGGGREVEGHRSWWGALSNWHGGVAFSHSCSLLSLALPGLVGEGHGGRRRMEGVYLSFPFAVSVPADPFSVECVQMREVILVDNCPTLARLFFRRCWGWKIDL